MMASRRSRLKAVANLPIRRKTLPVQQEAETTKFSEDKAIESNVENIENEQENKNSEETNLSEISETFDINSTEISATSTLNVKSKADEPESKKDKTVEVPSVENKDVRPACNNITSHNSRFGRRLKPSVSISALKDRTQREVKGESVSNNHDKQNISVENSLNVKNSGICDNNDDKPSLPLSRLNDETKTDTVKETICDNAVVNVEDGNVSTNETVEENENTDCSQNNLNSDADASVKDNEKTFQVEVSLCDSSAKDFIVNAVNTSQHNVVLQEQTKNVVIDSNKTLSENSCPLSNQNNNQPQNITTGFKRTVSSLRTKKPKYNDFARKVADARREFQRKYEKIPPDRSSLRMIDLIFYNPSTNPMESKSKFEKKDINVQDEEINEYNADDPEPSERCSLTNTDDDDLKDDDFGKMPVPQVKIGLNGEIILDEKSLIIETTDAKKGREDLQNSMPVFEDRGSKTYYYRRKTQKSRDWTDLETKRFYKALNTIGTDFSLMQKYFPVRTRLELKNKFKREEKLNRTLVDKALNNPSEFDITQFEKYLATEKQAQEETEGKIQRKVKIKRSGKKIRTKSSLMAREITESDEEASEFLTSLDSDTIRMQLNDRNKKANEINALYEKFAMTGVEKASENTQQPNQATSVGNENNTNGFNSNSIVFSDSNIQESSVTHKIRDAFDEIQNVRNSEKYIGRTETSDSEHRLMAESDKATENSSDRAGVVDEFYQAVVSLSASLKSGSCNNFKPLRVRKKTGRQKNNLEKNEKRKAQTQAGRKYTKKQKESQFVSTLDIETYDHKCDSNSSSNESNDNSCISTKTITDQDFMKLLAANAENMKESKIQFHITEDCSLEKNVEIILDNVPTLALNDI